MSFFGACNAQVAGVDDVSFLYTDSANNSVVGTISQIFEVVSSGQDPNSAWITPTIETPYLRGFMRLRRKWIPSAGLQTWRFLYVGYDLAGGGQLQVSYTTSLESNPSYSALPNWVGSLLSTVARVRRRIPLQIGPSNGAAFKLAVVNSGSAWTSFRLFELETEYYPRETSRV